MCIRKPYRSAAIGMLVLLGAGSALAAKVCPPGLEAEQPMVSHSIEQEDINDLIDNDFAEGEVEVEGVIQSINAANGTVTVNGILQVHGISKPYEIKVHLQVDNSSIQAQTEFPIKVADHKIKIPGLMGKNIAETVKVTIDASLVP